MSVYTLTIMHRVSDDAEYRKMAAGWIQTLESNFESIKRELLVKDRQE